MYDCANAAELKEYLSQVLSRTGSVGKKDKTLNRYLTAESALDICERGFLTLSTSEYLNDYLEHEMLKSIQKESRMAFSCFSGTEENIAMYKMYASAKNGVMLSMTYESAEQLIEQLPVSASGKKVLPIFRNRKLTDNYIEAGLYWAAVCYRELKNERLWSGTVFNNRIEHPLRENGLVGLVKLQGWEYEKEIRLIAEVEEPLEDNERIAVPLPKDYENGIRIVTRPGFDKSRNTAVLSGFKRLGIKVKSSEYDALIDLGEPEKNQGLNVRAEKNKNGDYRLVFE